MPDGPVPAADDLSSSPSARSPLTTTERAIVAHVASRREAAVDLLRRTVDIPSATENHEGVRRLGALYAQLFGEFGFETRWVDQSAVGRAGHFVAERGTRGVRLLVIGHLDTVLQGEAFRQDGRRAYGSGVADMKGGNLVALEALHALAVTGVLDELTVRIVFTGDEESTGEPFPVSRAALREVAAVSDVALAFEGHEPGTAVVGRRGYNAWRLRVRGTQGHSSGIFGERLGSGAILEAARILCGFRERLLEPHLTFSPGLILGGTDVGHEPAKSSGTAVGKNNVVPREALVEGDLRFLSRDQRDRARETMRAIVAEHLPRTSASLEFGDGMPAMEPKPANLALLALLDACSRDLGHGPVTAHDPSRRGAGDISFVAGDLPALDGLGAVGGGEHAPGEYVELAALPMQVERAAVLMCRLGRHSGAFVCGDPRG